MTSDQERLWIDGNRAAYHALLRHALAHLLPNNTMSLLETVATLAAEIEETRAAMRRVCSKHGDNDWTDTLNLADVVEKHLGRHLG